MAADPIQHVIVLMLENRSFDHILGDCPKIKGASPLSGINTYKGTSYPQANGAARVIGDDPKHDTSDVMVQLAASEGVAENGGFVLDYSNGYHDLTNASRAEVMKFHAFQSLPAMHALAEEFTVCDRWFASVPGPTWANRLFALSGTSLGRVEMPDGIMNLNLHWYDQPTIFDRLNEVSKRWKVYFGDAPLASLFVHQWEPKNAARLRLMPEFFEDVAGDPASFPDFAFIEPAYMQPGANDAHPPHDILDSDALVASVYNAIRAKDELWQSTLLVVLFDEHGGFYDHVSPPPAIPPDHHREEYSFDRYGLRVPALLISPYVGKGIFSEPLDHTSLLRYLQLKWNLGYLGDRTAAAGTFAAAIDGAPRVPALPAAPRPSRDSGAVPALALDRLTDHQSAIVALSHVLESMTDEDPNVVAARSRQVLSGPQSQIDAAVDRVSSFLAQQAAKAAGLPPGV